MAGKKIRSGVLAGCGLAAAAVLANGGSAKAATLFSTGFETAAEPNPSGFTSTGYTQGAYLTNQPGSGTSFTSSVTSDVASGTGSAVVATYAGTGFTPTSSNAQYVQINDLSGISSNTYAAYFPNLGSITPILAGTPVVDVVGTIAAISGTTGSAVFGLSAFDGTAAQNLVADVQVNAATGAVTAGGVSTGFTQTVSTATFVSYELQMNYSTGTYNVYEAPAGSATFTAKIASNLPFETAASTFSTGGFDTFATSTGSSTGLGLVDNLAISTSSGVPEPTTASLVIGGLVAAGSRRRRRTVAR